MKTSIIILTYNKLEYTVQCIESIRKYTKNESYEIIVVDNNSEDGTVKWLQEQNDIITILNKENLGFPGGCNAGIKLASGSEILLLNNDTIVTRNWLSNMLKALYSEESIGAVGCTTNNCSYRQQIPVSYSSIESMHDFAKEHNHSNAKFWNERLKLVGFCMLIKKKVVEEIGLLDERFFPGNYEDDDYSLRIRKAGYKLLLCKDTFIHHFGSVSFSDDINKFQDLMSSNAKKYEKKWGFDPEYSQYAREEIINLINEREDKQLNILDIGCACGGTLLEIKNRYNRSNLYGIESNKYSAEVASMICEVKSLNVETNDLPYENEFFDYIIVADVLEHLINPWEVVRNLKRFLKKDGRLLISVLNVMHLSVVRKLLTQGRWKYEDAGTLDRKHLRFFTYESLQEMLIQQEYIDIKIQGISMPISNEDELFHLELAQICPKHLMEQFKIDQYLVSASNNDLAETIEFINRNPDKRQEIFERLNKYSSKDIINAGKRFPKDKRVQALNSISVVNFENGRFERVIPFLEEARELDDENSEVLYNLIYFLQHIGEIDLAQEYMVLLKELDLQIYEQLLSVISLQ
ncbi:glycosyltransferase [Paenibacillus graminis]|uniref:glycosyltransferase n=1 Tax=Paenibacillus graminis TaxID=189425 RepID=UPI002DB5D17A|nr:glycosyltransferase [Paenibacillus graminis]MEC0171901.1 glycosyltransferase [Paenibacillus graminis]